MTIMKILLGIFLLICALIDLKTKKVEGLLLVVFAAAGIILYLIVRPVGLIEEMTGVLMGAAFILIWHVTGGKIGLGDALLMVVTGIFLGGKDNAALIMGAMLLAALYSGFMLMIKKADRTKEIAFVPFLFLSYLGMAVI